MYKLEIVLYQSRVRFFLYRLIKKLVYLIFIPTLWVTV